MAGFSKKPTVNGPSETRPPRVNAELPGHNIMSMSCDPIGGMISSQTPANGLGIRIIDEQHKRITGFIILVDRIDGNKRDVMINNKMLWTLRELFQRHFIAEEDVMFGIMYPNANAHMIEHSTMLNTYDMTRLDFERAGDPSALLTFTRGWIAGHMANDDMKFVT